MYSIIIIITKNIIYEAQYAYPTLLLFIIVNAEFPKPVDTARHSPFKDISNFTTCSFPSNPSPLKSKTKKKTKVPLSQRVGYI